MASARPPKMGLTVSPDDAWIVRDVDRAMSDAIRIRKWWLAREAARSYSDHFDVAKLPAASDRAEGFFDETDVSFGRIRVFGLTQDLLFDRPRFESAECSR